AETTNIDDSLQFVNIKPIDTHDNGIVVFADDSSVARGQIQRTLDALGVKYVSAVNGRAAWDELRKLANYAESSGRKAKDLIYLILTDVEMPEMDGYILTKNIKSDPAFAGIPVLMHSSLSSMSNQQLGKSVGVDEYVSKFEAQRLAGALARGVHARPAAIANAEGSPYMDGGLDLPDKDALLGSADARTKRAGSNRMEILLFELGTH